MDKSNHWIHAHLFAHMDSKVVVSHMAVIAIVGPFHKGGHGCDDAIVTVYMVQIQFVLCLVRSLIHNSTIPGDDVQLIGRFQDRLELFPILPAAKDTCRYTFERKRELIRA